MHRRHFWHEYGRGPVVVLRFLNGLQICGTEYNTVLRMAQVWTNGAELLFKVVDEFEFFGTHLTLETAFYSQIFHENQ